MTFFPLSPSPFILPTMVINGEEIPRGSRRRIEIPVARLPSGPLLSLPVIVLRGESDGPSVFLDAAIHGDEIDGIDTILNILDRLSPASLKGTVIAVPVVNVYGFMTQDRYLPDRRDLNRSFPGSESGSMAARLANLFMTEVVRHCSVGIDFHAGSLHRTNMPQLRADLSDPETLRLAEAFGPRVIVNAKLRPGSLREAAGKLGIKVLVHEAGEPSRFDPVSMKQGIQGTIRVLYALGLIDQEPPASRFEPIRIGNTKWIRA
ncbi:MAG: succinylglutamate desuccinylase/aspartoacylase family protein, partial [Thermoanaerobaculia bacterium]|nr:succinylglutamate desuccinylase/aspartoacylase family protein [Thermoanaerobaculia bacterium]